MWHLKLLLILITQIPCTFFMDRPNNFETHYFIDYIQQIFMRLLRACHSNLMSNMPGTHEIKHKKILALVELTF